MNTFILLIYLVIFHSPSYLYRFHFYFGKISVLITKYEETIINEHKMTESV